MQNSQKKPLNPTGLPLADAAKLLSAASGIAVSVEQLQADIASGAPTNPDGTLNLIHFASWLAKETGRGD